MTDRLVWIEAARTLAMAMVVLSHVNDLVYLQQGNKTWWSVALSVLVCFAVPCFFMISGYLLTGRRFDNRQPASASVFFQKKLTTLIIPFLSWNVVYLVVFKAFYGWPILSAKTVWYLLTGYLHLYFVFVLIQFFVIYQWIAPRLSERGWRVVTNVAAGLSLSFYLVSEWVLLEKGGDLHFFEWVYGKAFIGWSVFFFWGCWLGRNPERLPLLSRRLHWLGLLSLLTFLAYYSQTYREISVFGYNVRQYFLLNGLFFQWTAANLVLAALYRRDHAVSEKPILNRLAGWGRDTFGIYLSHLVFIIILVKLRAALVPEAPPYLTLPLLFLLTWVLSGALLRLFRRPDFSGLGRILFGARP